ncbi:IucA/IucC family siderophore biosynthesis protein [Motiliproteus sp. MSK22-1]|uniref:IucA/IucC family protein n=1 Tax=Motiliproteus sp. MSK22-1 TaxID=1897630 RepID=UPI000977DFE8|nr:IucA/IucC family protein [Motiliproteus sp. MSK22-1]OMH33820.1 hypothetical protein BGP75_12590 [Motiliproteus sp. MSK22-1]
MDKYSQLLSHPAWDQARERVLRQLFEALMFEEAFKKATIKGDLISIPAQGIRTGTEVSYCCRIRETHSFARHRIIEGPWRVEGDRWQPVTDLAQVLNELSSNIGADPARLKAFVSELRSTQIKQAEVLAQRGQQPLRTLSFNQIESRLTDGHPYHPSFKSRLGFTLADSALYAPEYAPIVTPLLFAVKQSAAVVSATAEMPFSDVIRAALGEAIWDLYQQQLSSRALNLDDYLPLPVHPWQWDEVLALECHEAIKSNEMIYLGQLQGYLPQQSIRTLANAEHVENSNIKLSMSLVNTSTSRVLAPHTVANAGGISDWLADIVAEDNYWQDQTRRPIILKEFFAVAYKPAYSSQNGYGAASCIWRQSIQSQLMEGESALPISALIYQDHDNHPLITPWIDQYGTHAWLTELFQQVYLPVLHLLWKHGLALESHAQNMMLVHKQGMPQRVALKDFHDGVRFKKEFLIDHSYLERLAEAPAEHSAVNPNSFLETLDADELRDFCYDALAFVNLAELAWFMEQNFNYSESMFWELFARILKDYQQSHPDLNERFKLFNVFAEKVQIEQLASRRFQPEIRQRVIEKPNPLAPYRAGSEHE